jgi:hypothetical protein
MLFRKRRYPVTPTLSEDAVHDSVTDVWPTPPTPSPVGLEGACVSGQALVDGAIVAFADTFPAAS